MKRSLHSALAFLALGAVVISCDDAYDLNNIEKEITVLPGLSVSINQSLDDVSSDNMLDLSSLGTGSDYDDSGNYLVNSSSNSIASTVSGSDYSAFLSGNEMSIDGTLTLSFDVPDFMKDAESDFNIPTAAIQLHASGFAGCTLSGIAKKGNVSVPFTGVVSYEDVLLIDSDEIKALFSKFDGDILLTNLKVKVPSVMPTSEYKVALVGSLSYTLQAKSLFTLTFAPGSSLSYTYTFKLDELGMDFSKFSFTAEKFMAQVNVKNSLPLELSIVSIKTSDINGSIEVSPAIAAGTVDSPATTTVTATVVSTTPVSEVKKVTCTIKAVNKTASPVTINKGQSISLTFGELKLISGITVDF